MIGVFLTVMKMSLSASIAALIVIIARLCLRKVPKVFSYLLWSVVLFRMICPVGIPLSVNWLPERSSESTVSDVTHNTYIADYAPSSPFEIETPEQEDNTSNTASNHNTVVTEDSDNHKEIIISVICVLWLIGAAFYLSRLLYSYLRLRKQLPTAVLCKDGIYESARVTSPFVIGWLKPRIYVPTGLDNVQRASVIAHERIHIRRGDHFIKLITNIALAIHWFNPLMWLSYSLACADMESSCDESAIKKLVTQSNNSKEIIISYCRTILCLAERNSDSIYASFSGNNVKERMRNVMRYKDHKPLTMIAAGSICLVLILCCAVKLTVTDAAAAGSEESAPIVSLSDAEPTFSQTMTVEYPVTLSVGNITIEKDDTRIGLSTGQAAALTDEDIAIINNSPQVYSITMLGANLKDLNRLALLENITSLNLSGCNETDFSPLTSIKKLERLEINCCLCITDFSFLADCDNLEYLSVYDCEDVNNISIQGIASAKNLRELNIAHLYNVTDISALGTLKNLEILYLSQTGNATGFSFIPLLDNLQELYLSEVGINNIDFLSSMKQLKKLEVGYCRLLLDDSGYRVEKVEDLSPLASMAELEYLYIADMDVYDISVLSGLTNLNELFIFDTGITDLTPLYGLAKLKQVSLLDTKCTVRQFAELQKALPDCEIITEGIG